MSDPDLRRHWHLPEDLAFLNHGSFGACPRTVLEEQARIRERMERQPVDFFVRRYELELDGTRGALALFLGGKGEERLAEGLVMVPNATAGVNTVLRSLEHDSDQGCMKALGPGDEVVVTDHEYTACRNALDFVARRTGARVRVARIPFPLESRDQASSAVLAEVSSKTRLLLIDHVTSQTGLVLPLEEILRALPEETGGRGDLVVLVDGAHAPGMIELDLEALERLGVTHYTGNGHKWMCGPKGAGFLWVREDHRRWVRPLSISHGASTPRPGRSRFHTEFDWTGTADPSAFFCLPRALDFLNLVLPGGWAAVRRHNRRLVLEGRRLLCEALEIPEPAPAEMIGALASVPLPDGSPEPPKSALYSDPLQEELLRDHRIEVPVIPWPAPPKRLLRLSAQVYNRPREYERLARVLPGLLASRSGC